MPEFKKRTTKFVDAESQGALLLRAVLHWTFMIVGTSVVLVAFQHLLAAPHQDFGQTVQEAVSRYGPAFVVLLALLPVVVYDTLKLSNRLAGPLFRLRRVTQKLVDGEPVTALQFRRGDFCQDLAENFNRLLERIQSRHETDHDVTELEEAAPPR